MGDRQGSPLIGKWLTDPQDRRSRRRFGAVTLEFTPDGWLIYTVESAGRAQEMLLSYRVHGNLIVTDQPTALREERTRYLLTPDGKLTLIHGRERSTYVRARSV